MICYKNQAQIVLQMAILDNNGTSKTDILFGYVRIYRIVSGAEQNILSSIAMVQVSTTNIFRYIWEPSSLAIGQYYIEYIFTDNNNNVSKTIEELSVLNTPLASDIEIIRQIQTGRWKIYNNQMVFYSEDGTTELLTFNLYDLSGNPTSTNVMERVPV